MSAIKTPIYNLAKFLIPLLEAITTNMYTVKNNFEFAKEIAEQDPGLFMASLDVESLFTDIPLEETRCVCCNSLFNNDAKVNNINRIDFEKLLRAALQNNFFNFEGKIYKQIDGVTMEYPLGPILANVFLCFHEQIWFNECPDEFKPVYYRRCVHDIFVLFRLPDHLEIFKNYLISKHGHIRFTCEKEQNNSMPFLDVLITRTSNGFKTFAYHKLHLGEYIQISAVSFRKNISLRIDFHFIISNIFSCFGFFRKNVI